MTEIVSAPARLASVARSDSGAAFKLANRHTTRVKWLRRLILFGSVGICVGIAAFILFDPFRAVLPADMSIDGAGLNGSRVTMAKPKMSGFRSDGRPYDFIATTAVQDLKTPNILELNTLEAHVTMPDKSVAHITADRGVYDSSRDTMDMTGSIHLVGGSGYDVRMSAAHVEFKGGNVRSPDPVVVVMQTGSVNADTMTMVDNGKQITFEGHVHSIMRPASDETATVSQMKGTVQ